MKQVRVQTLVILWALGSTGCATPVSGPAYPQLTDPGGCLVEQVTSADHDQFQVRGVSRDGRLLAYAWNKGEDSAGKPRRGAVMRDLKTGRETSIDPGIDNSGNFSPDSQHLVVASHAANGRTDIFEITVASGEIRAIAAHDQWDWLPAYSSDGRAIVFNSMRGDQQMDVYVYERATGELERITRFDGYDAHAQFAPDDSKILFHRMNSERTDGGYDFDLFIFDRETRSETQLTDGPFENSYGAFAPDGQHVVFSSDRDAAPQKLNLYVRAPDGSVARLTQGAWKDSYGHWTRDGKHIYFNSDRLGTTQVFRIPMQGADCRRG